jgi:parallel beta-helix repeat protein
MPNPLIRHRVGVYLENSNNCLVIDNAIMNWDTYGVYMAGTSTNNIIVENGFYSYPIGHTNLVVDDSTGMNYLTRIQTPGRKDLFEGPVTPTPGYYPGSSYNTAGDGFECEDDGPYANSLWSATGTGTGWTTTIEASKTDSNGKIHKKVLESYTGSFPILTVDHDIGELHDSGTTEFWFLTSDPSMSGSASFSLNSGTDNLLCKILLENNLFKYTDGLSIISTTIPADYSRFNRLSSSN